MGPESEAGESAPSQAVKQTRGFVRGFAAASYLLGRRRQALSAPVLASDPAAQQALLEVTSELGHPARERRARALANEVGRLMRSLGAQRLK